MKRFGIFVIIFLAISFALFANNPTPVKNIVLPIELFVSKCDWKAYNASTWSVVSYGAKNGGRTGTEKAFFESLEKAWQTESNTQKSDKRAYKVFWKGLEAPEVIVRTLTSTREPLEEINTIIKRKIDESTELITGDKQALKDMCDIAFKRKTQAEIMNVHSEAFDLVQKLKRAGFQVFIADNFNGEVLEELQRNHPQLKQLSVTCSSELGATKSPAFYKKVMEKLKLSTQNTLFVESHPAYKSYLEEHDPAAKVIVCNDPTINAKIACIEKFVDLVAHLTKS